jgi:hypothetical protein
VKPCIYCVEKKPDDDFNREHVVQQAFGSFDTSNLVLDCVCTDCNDYFGRTIDLTLARDSIEGFDRYLSGMRPTSKYKGLGARSKTFVEFKEGTMKGATGYITANPDGGELWVLPLPQIGFSQPHVNNGEPLWFFRDEVPTVDELEQRFAFKKGETLNIQCPGLEWDDAAAILAEKDFKKVEQVGEMPPLVGRVFTETVGQVGRTQMRAAAKVAFNYLAAVAGAALVRCPQFNDVRDFIRFDRGLNYVMASRNPWGVFGASGRVPRGHYLAVETRPSGQIVAQVSLMLRVRYVIPLTLIRFTTGVPRVSSAHFFDVARKAIGTLPVPPLVTAAPLQKWQGRKTPWQS